MLGILVTGPNASGKTTALQRAAVGYEHDPRLRIVYADNSDRSTFKGDAPAMVDRLELIWQEPPDIVVVEGTRMPTIVERVAARNPGRRTLMAFVTTVDPATMEAHIRGRCTLLGKRFRDDYWKEDKLLYEGTRRYRKSVPRFIPETAIEWYQIDREYQESARMTNDMRAVFTSVLGPPIYVAPPPVDLTPQPGKLF